MKPILSTGERVKADPNYVEHDIDSRDGIVMAHPDAELKETRSQLIQRTIQPTRALQHDLNILKGLKREFVDSMIARGIQYNTAREFSQILNLGLADLEDAIKGEHVKF